jgi:pheromone shutdown protein TraB
MATSTGMEPTMEMERAMDVAERSGNDVAMDEAT